MGRTDRIYMKMFDLEDLAGGLQGEQSNILGLVEEVNEEIKNFNWWKGSGANEFIGPLIVWGRECRDFSTRLYLLYDRVREEVKEWAECDLGYQYSQESFVNRLSAALSDVVISNWSDGSGSILEFEAKLPFNISPSLPWWAQYPPESETKRYQSFPGGWWTEEKTDYGKIESGAYGGWSVDGKWNLAGGLGLFFAGTMGSKSWSRSLFGLPATVTLRGPAYSLKGGIGSEAVLSAGGIDYSFCGIKIGFDLGWGTGVSLTDGHFGPFSIGVDQEQMADISAGTTDVGPPAESLW
jgi:hypothetical protein